MQTSPNKNMSFAQTYMFASTVRNKLTKQASNPNSSLRVLVTQANMLDNIMDHVADETDKRTKKSVSAPLDDDLKHVSFQLPDKKTQDRISTNITEYEVGSESDSDSDSDSYSDDNDESDSDSDYYYSDSEEEEEMQAPIQIAKIQSYRQLPSMDLSKYTIEEEESMHVEDNEIPELSRSLSLTDDENSSLSDEEDLEQPKYTYLPAHCATSCNHRKTEDENTTEKDLSITNLSNHYASHHNASPNTFVIGNIF